MSPQSEATSQLVIEAAEYSSSERALLLQLAHDSIDAALDCRHISLDSSTPHLDEPRGAFTTLHLGGKLRGCVGYVLPVQALYRTIAETAIAAAFQDDRFPPVTRQEASDLEIEISVLSPMKPITPEEIVVGKHGLMLSKGFHRGLLLPQVPVEWRWDRETFLEQTCRKAGLPTDAWKSGAMIEAFTAEHFSDQELRHSR